MKTVMIALAAVAMGGVANAITSEEIANALGVDPNIATFSLGGVSEFTIDSGTYHAGGSSIRSGAITGDSSNFRTSDLVFTIEAKQACVLSYWIKRSMYNDQYYYRVIETIDNASYTTGGNADWYNARHVLVPGTHNVRFSFQRRHNYNPSGYEECVWFDDLSLVPIMPTASKVEVTNIKCQQRYPWNGMVDIDYTVTSDDPNADVWVYPIGYDKDSNTSMAPRALTGDGVNAPVKAGTHRMTWTVTEDYPDFHSTAFTVKMIALVGAAPYMVVDLSGGVDAISYPVSYLSSVPEGGWGDEYKTTKLVLRLIPPGSFMMGSPSDENGRSSCEDLHGVVLTKPFYIGVFEVTQKQYELIMGGNPSNYKGNTRPVERVSYNDIRGAVNGAGWPTHNQVDANSFMGRLRSKVNMLFDLPTEAQWEYACRAGTSTGLNSGKIYDGWANLSEVARWWYNYINYGSQQVWDGKGGYDCTAIVGSYLGNNWGLYDMHGNVREICRDFWNYGLGNGGVIDPKGSATSRDHNYDGGRRYRVNRGGCFTDSDRCRSAYRDTYMNAPSTSADTGFRVMCSPVSE